MFLFLPAIGSIAFSPSALMASHPMIAYEIAGHTLGHILYGFIKRNRKRKARLFLASPAPLMPPMMPQWRSARWPDWRGKILLAQSA